MYHFIVNPISKSGRGRSIWKDLKPVLDEQNIEYKFYFTKGYQHATRLARNICNRYEDPFIVILGGDGTLNEVINGIVDFSKVKFSYIPTGSSNDFARGIPVSTDPQAMLERILSGGVELNVDVATMTTSEGASRRFLVSTGIGCDADICTRNIKSNFKDFLNYIRLGKLTYVSSAVKIITEYKPVSGYVMVDDNRIPLKDCMFSVIHNTPYEGGGIEFCPDAECTDGLLDICIVQGVSKADIFTLLPLGFSGKHTGKKGVTNLQGKKISIHYDDARPTHTDGENNDLQTDISAEVTDKAVFII